MAVRIDNLSDRRKFVAPTGGVTALVPVAVEDVVVIPAETAAETESFTGIYRDHTVRDFPAATGEAWEVGDVLYWDDSEGVATISDDTGTNKAFATAAAVKLSAASIGDLDLTGRPLI
jgi:predicted RecA/RadA family phage recombinase